MLLVLSLIIPFVPAAAYAEETAGSTSETSRGEKERSAEKKGEKKQDSAPRASEEASSQSSSQAPENAAQAEEKKSEASEVSEKASSQASSQAPENAAKSEEKKPEASEASAEASSQASSQASENAAKTDEKKPESSSEDAKNPQNPTQPVLELNVYFVTTKGAVAAQPLRYRFEKGWKKTTTVKAPALEGYTPDRESVTIDFSKYTEATNEIVITYHPKLVTYFAEYKLESLEGEYVVAKKAELTGYVGELTQAPVKSFEGFTVKTVPKAAALPVKDKSVTLEFLYSRNSYQLSFNTDGGSEIAARHIYFETPIANLAEPKRTGMKFDGWYLDSAKTKPFVNKTPMPARDMSLYAKWSPADTEYNVRYLVQDPNHPDLYSPIATIRRAGVTGQPTQVPEGTLGIDFPGLGDDVKDWVDTFYVRDEAKTKASIAAHPTIASDGSTTVDVYYNRREFTLTFVPDGTKTGEVRHAPFDPDTFGWVPVITIGGKTYTKPYYKIHVRFGQSLKGIFPTVDQVVVPRDNPVTYNQSFMSFSRIYFLEGKKPGGVIARGNANPNIVDTGYGKTARTNGSYDIYVGIRIAETSWIQHGRMNFYFENLKGKYPDKPDIVQPKTYTFKFLFDTPNPRVGFFYDIKHMFNPYPSDPNARAFEIKRPDGKTPICDVYMLRIKSNLTVYMDGTAATKRDLGKVFYDYPLFGDAEYPAILPKPTEADRPAWAPKDFEFGGWYLDPEFKYPLAAGSKMPDYEITLFGKWEPKNENLSVTFDTKITGTAADRTTVQVPYGKKVARPEDPARPGYRFLGWEVESTSKALPDYYDFEAGVVKDMTLAAVWQENAISDVTVRYVKSDTGEVIKEETVKDLPVGMSFSAEAIPVDRYLPDVRVQSVTVAPDPAKNTIVFRYAPFTETSYTIEYYEKKKDDSEVLLKKEGPVKTELNSDSLIAKDIPGYKPVGRIQQTLLFVQDPSKNVFKFYYADADMGSYRVEYFYGDGKGDYIRNPAQDEFHVVNLGTTVSVNPPEFVRTYMLDLEISTLYGTVTLDHDPVLKVYYNPEKKPAAPTPKKPQKPATRAPKTGDGTLIPYAMLLLAAAAASPVVLKARKREENER